MRRKRNMEIKKQSVTGRRTVMAATGLRETERHADKRRYYRRRRVVPCTINIIRGQVYRLYGQRVSSVAVVAPPYSPSSYARRTPDARPADAACLGRCGARVLLRADHVSNVIRAEDDVPETSHDVGAARARGMISHHTIVYRRQERPLRAVFPPTY